MNSKTILITGAGGFIGRRMIAAAQARGYRVIGLDRTVPSEATQAAGVPPGTRSPKLGTPGGEVTWLIADITSAAPIELPEGIDTIIHLAGKAHALAEVAQDEAEYFRINTEGTRRMLEAGQRAGVRAFVLFSTVKAAGDRGVCERAAPRGHAEAVRAQGPTLQGNVEPGAAFAPFDETCPQPPDTPYGKSKRAAEKLVLEGGHVPHPVVLRPCLVYGPTPKGNLEKMISAVRCGRFPPLPEVGNKRSMVHVDDVIAAALLVAEHPAAAGQVFIAADNEPFSTRQLFEWICSATGRAVPRWRMPLWALRLLGRIGDGIGLLRGRRFIFDSDALAKLTGSAWYSSAKLQRELGWHPQHTLRETMPEIAGRL